MELSLADSVRSGVEQLIRVAGSGAIKPNTVLLGFHDDSQQLDDLSSPTSPFSNPDFAGMLEADEPDTRISPEDYVGIIDDTLKQ